MAETETTWDGLPVAREPPYACCIVVWRQAAGGREFLILHRLHAGGSEHHGEWAWTPPSGARLPDETADEAAERELREETGLVLPLRAIPEAAASENIALYVAEAAADADVCLDHEHDVFGWLSLDGAVERCLPPEVGASIRNAAAWLDGRSDRR